MTTKRAVPRHPSLSESAVGRRPRAGLYLRLSDDPKKRSRSKADQEREGREVCRVEDWDPFNVYSEDEAISASRFANGKVREDWERLLDDLEAGRLDVLIFWEVSRGSRILGRWADMLDLCRDLGVLIYITSEEDLYDVRKPSHYERLATAGVKAAVESETTSLRVGRDMAGAALRGLPHGACPYGYEREYDSKRGGALLAQRPHEDRVGEDGETIIPGTAPIVREIVRRVGNGEPIRTIRNDLNARGVPTPRATWRRKKPAVGPRQAGTWNDSSVRSIALSVTSIGKRNYKGEILDGNWPPLITEADHYAVRRLLGEETRKTTRPGGVKWLLSNIASCAECGAHLSVKAANLERRPNRPHSVYLCSASTCCSSTRVEWLDDLVLTTVGRRLADPDLRSAITPADDAEVVAAREEAAMLRTRLEDFRTAAIEGELTAASLATMEAGIGRKIAEADRRAAAATVPGPLRNLLAGDVSTEAEIIDRFLEFDVTGQREILRALVRAIGLRSARGGPCRPQELDADRVVLTWRVWGEA